MIMGMKSELNWLPLALVSLAAAAGQWERQPPPALLEMVEPVYSLAFADADHGVAVGHSGWILLTDNGGVDWKHQKVRPDGTDVFSWGTVFREGSHIVAFGNTLNNTYVGYRLESNDAGKSWDMKKAGTEPLWNQVARSAPGVYFSNGLNDRILKSSDGGLNWKRIEPPLDTGSLSKHEYSVQGFSFPSPNIGYCVGSDKQYSEGDVLLKTADAGETWTRILNKVDMVEAEFPSEDTGFVFATTVGFAQVLKTTNGGATFDTVFSYKTSNRFKHMVFESTLSGWAFLDNGAVFRTRDGGKSWTTEGWASTNPYTGSKPIIANKGVLYRMYGASIDFTKNDGKDWTSGSRGKNGTFMSVGFPSANTGLIVGWVGTVLRTENGGTSWVGVNYGSDAEPIYLQFTDGETGYMALYGAGLLKTADGGKTWSNPVLNPKDSLWSPWFTDSRHGRAIGSKGRLLLSSDGGATWAAQATPPWGWVELRVPGFIGVTNSVQSYTSTDDGKTWDTTKIDWAPNYSPSINALHYRDSKLGFIVGENQDYSGVIARTIDGGKHWTSQTDKNWGSIFGVTFGGGDTLYAYGNQNPFSNNNLQGTKALILQSLDAGASWENMKVENVPDPGYWDHSMNAITSLTISNGTGWAVAAGGTILKFQGLGGSAIRASQSWTGDISFERGNLRLTLKESSLVSLALADIRGRTVTQIFSGMAKEGAQVFRLPQDYFSKSFVLVLSVNGKTRYIRN
jgi:photosystem II stability/assembly factor-like uncharacterized protein